MAISTNGGSNPTSVTYNGKNVTEVWYKSSPTADAVYVWPEQIKKLYKRFNKSNGTMYLRSTPYSGYVEHTGGPVYGENNAYCLPADIKYVVTEEPIVCPPDMHFFLAKCSSLTSLDVSKWDTSKVTNMNYMFGWCKNITAYTEINSLDVSNTEYMQGVFYDNEKLSTLDISNWIANKCATFVDFFSECWKLSTVSLANLIKVPKANIAFMFNRCKVLATLDISGWVPCRIYWDYVSGTTSGKNDGTFFECYKLTSIYMNRNFKVDFEATGGALDNTFKHDEKLKGAISYSDAKLTADYATIAGYGTLKN